MRVRLLESGQAAGVALYYCHSLVPKRDARGQQDQSQGRTYEGRGRQQIEGIRPIKSE